MSRREPISEERLDALRTMNLAVLVPASAHWREATRRQYARWLAKLAPVLTELLDEIDMLDEALDESETELDQVLGELRTLREPTQPVQVSGARVRPTGDRRWRVLWREDGKSLSATHYTRREAEGHMLALRDLERRGGAR